MKIKNIVLIALLLLAITNVTTAENTEIVSEHIDTETTGNNTTVSENVTADSNQTADNTTVSEDINVTINQTVENGTIDVFINGTESLDQNTTAENMTEPEIKANKAVIVLVGSILLAGVILLWLSERNRPEEPESI